MIDILLVLFSKGIFFDVLEGVTSKKLSLAPLESSKSSFHIKSMIPLTYSLYNLQFYTNFEGKSFNSQLYYSCSYIFVFFNDIKW